MKVIKTELEYKKALTRLLEIFDATPNTPEGEESELLSVLVEHYEIKHNAISEPDPIAYLEYIMEKKGLKKADLVKLGIFSSRPRASEVFSRKRSLTKGQINRIHTGLKIPYRFLFSKDEDVKWLVKNEPVLEKKSKGSGPSSLKVTKISKSKRRGLETS